MKSQKMCAKVQLRILIKCHETYYGHFGAVIFKKTLHFDILWASLESPLNSFSEFQRIMVWGCKRCIQ